MSSVPPVSDAANTIFAPGSALRIRTSDTFAPVTEVTPIEKARLNPDVLTRITRLRDALSRVKTFDRKLAAPVRRSASTTAATAVSASIDFGDPAPFNLKSTEEINTAPTSFSQRGPNLIGSTLTAPWSGLGSTSLATVSGNYDGANGNGPLTFRVTRDGTRGVDDLRLDVFSGTDQIDRIDIRKEDALNTVYQLDNGIELTLGAGDFVQNDEFVVDVSILSTDYTPAADWVGSTAMPTITGTYTGIETGDITFEVSKDGVRGEDDLRIDVYSPSGARTDQVDIDKNDPLNTTYSLSNGLELTLTDGELLKDSTFKIAVEGLSLSGAVNETPDWDTSTASPTFSGTYDSSMGTGTLSLEVRAGGTVGEDDLQLRFLNTDGATIEDITIDKNDPTGTTYSLGNGILFSLSAGNLNKGENFSIDVEASTTIATSPNPVASTSEVTIGGVYDGTQGASDLSFYVAQGGTRGSDDIVVELRDENGTTIESLNLLASDSVDTVYNLANGLTLNSAAGTLVQGESFVVSVNDAVGTSVNPDMAFNGTRNSDPQFDEGFEVTDGSFQLNGTTIEVFSSDSLNDVLNRITASAAGVAASFDAATETIQFTHGTDDIVIENDTSGFVAATKLSNASATGGDAGNSPIADFAPFAGISSGMIDINGTQIAVDVEHDSFLEMVSRINASGAGVDVVYDVLTGEVRIVAQNNGDFELDSGSTGFFEALSIANGVYRSTTQVTETGSLANRTRREFTSSVDQLLTAFNDLFETDNLGKSQLLSDLRTDVTKELSQLFEGSISQQRAAELGLQFDISEQASGNLAHIELDSLESTLRSKTQTGDLRDLLFGKNGSSNALIDRLEDLLLESERNASLNLIQQSMGFSILA